MKSQIACLAASVALVLTTAIAPAQASSFTLDFNTAPDGTALNPYQLDSLSGQTLGTQTFSTSSGNIGNIWKSIGIGIGAIDSKAPLGLFNTNCLPYSSDGTPGRSVDGFTQPCNLDNRDGDPDLATGAGSYNAVSYDTVPQGNALIFEETPGIGLPDDTTYGGTIQFDFDLETVLASVKLSQVGIVDNTEGTLVVNFIDGSSVTKTLNNNRENQLQFFNLSDTEQMKVVKNFSVAFNGSGAVTGVVFSEFQQREKIPEPTVLWGVLAATGIGFGYKRGRSSREDA